MASRCAARVRNAFIAASLPHAVSVQKTFPGFTSVFSFRNPPARSLPQKFLALSLTLDVHSRRGDTNGTYFYAEISRIHPPSADIFSLCICGVVGYWTCWADYPPLFPKDGRVLSYQPILLACRIFNQLEWNRTNGVLRWPAGSAAAFRTIVAVEGGAAMVRDYFRLVRSDHSRCSLCGAMVWRGAGVSAGASCGADWFAANTGVRCWSGGRRIWMARLRASADSGNAVAAFGEPDTGCDPRGVARAAILHYYDVAEPFVISSLLHRSDFHSHHRYVALSADGRQFASGNSGALDEQLL